MAGRRYIFTDTDYLEYIQSLWDYEDYDICDEEEPMDVDQVPTKKDVTSTLKVLKVDLCIESNTRNHHTNAYDITDKSAYGPTEKLVLRRGQEFNVKITFNRKYDEKKDDLRLVFTFGKRPMETMGTYVECILSEKDFPKHWGAYIASTDGNTVSFVFLTPPTCAVGKWVLEVGVVKPTDTKPSLLRYRHPDPIYILFNPWCKDDQVYMKDEKYTQEYVLEEAGIVYTGYSSKEWMFGQFSGKVLDCVLYLLDQKSKDIIDDRNRGDPVLVSRTLSSLINCCDNDGVIVGNWSGTYKGGTSPLSWIGSVAILEEYYDNKRPVEYGQCWVFSGVLTTVCRALGIPARSVTNIGSAHDTNGSITIDTYLDEEGDEIGYMNGDSVWNFHVWNDVWMARPDLPSGYGGWQALDSTPQEESGGIFCMGPMSVLAIKRGDVHLQYDGNFVFSEVNADRVTWVRDPITKRMCAKNVMTSGIGKYLFTKQPFSKRRDDIKAEYKYAEGSHEERAAVRHANLHSKLSADHGVLYGKPKEEDLIVFKLTYDEVCVGGPIKLCLKVTNTTNSVKTITGTTRLTSMYYTGVTHQVVRKDQYKNTILKAKEEKYFSMEVLVDDYWPKAMDHCIFRISCMFSVHETKQTYISAEDLGLSKPDLAIKAPATGNIGKIFEVEVSFKNPLLMALTGCQLLVEGPGLQQHKTYGQKDVKPNGTFSSKFYLTPVKSGKKDIIVAFTSTQLSGIQVAQSVNISK